MTVDGGGCGVGDGVGASGSDSDLAMEVADRQVVVFFWVHLWS